MRVRPKMRKFILCHFKLPLCQGVAHTVFRAVAAALNIETIAVRSRGGERGTFCAYFLSYTRQPAPFNDDSLQCSGAPAHNISVVGAEAVKPSNQSITTAASSR